MRKLYAFTLDANIGSRDVLAYAMADDGHPLASHLCSHPGWAFGDLDLISVDKAPLGGEYDKRHAYIAHLGAEYEVVNLIGQEWDALMQHAGFAGAYAKNQELKRLHEATSTPRSAPNDDA